jgi:hypothetical protein
MIGPVAIDQGRGSYNNVIQSTSKDMTFANILRVYHHEPTSFMDVTEVDATTTFSGTVNGGVAGIGARSGTSGGTLAGQVESVAGGATYSESPLVRYQPLLGQALVAQLATPVGPDQLASLYESSWGIAPVLDFAASYLTLDYDETYAALNALAALDAMSRIELVGEASALTKSKDTTKSGTIGKINGANVVLEVTNKASSNGASDSLTVYFLPFHPHAPRGDHDDEIRENRLWNMVLRLYANTQPEAAKCPSSKYLTNLDEKPDCLSIELRTLPVLPDKVKSNHLWSGAPLMKTYSALGILKNAVEPPYPRIGFVSPEVYRRIRDYEWNKYAQNPDLNFYTLFPEDENGIIDGHPADEKPYQSRHEQEEDQHVTSEVIAFLQKNPRRPYVYISGSADITGNDFVSGNDRLGHLRRYVLITVSDNSPPDAYVSHFYQGHWYSIAGDDEISQKNFDLISLFMTMMAVPSTTPPVGTSISVGGG